MTLFPALFLDVVMLWFAIYAVLLATYFITGWIIEKVICKNPELQIQQGVSIPWETKRIDIKQSVVSLIYISFFIAAGFGFQRQGLSVFTPSHLPLIQAIFAYPIYFVVSLVLFDTWFYWMHRLAHVHPFFKYVHSWHHRQSLRAPSTWANNSDTFLDDLFLQSYWFFAFVFLPFPATVLFTHKLFDQVTGMIGHSGYEISGSLPLRYKFLVAVLHHDQHHSAVKYNFATHFSWWDRAMGTLHPEYDRKNESFKR